MSRAVRLLGAAALAVGLTVAGPATAAVAAPPSGERCGVYRVYPGSDYDMVVWKNCSSGEQLVHVDRVAYPDKYMCVGAGKKVMAGYYGKVGPYSARDAWLSGNRC